MGRNRKILSTKARKVAYEGSILKNVCTRKKRTLRKKSVAFNLDNLNRIQERELLPYKKYSETLQIEKEQSDNKKMNMDIVSETDFTNKTEESENYGDFKLEDVVNENLVHETDFEIKLKAEENINKINDTDEKFPTEDDVSENYDFPKLEDIVKGNLEPETEYEIQIEAEENKETHIEGNGSSENKVALKANKHLSAFQSMKGGKFIPQPGQLKCEDFYLSYYQEIQRENHNKAFIDMEDHCRVNFQPYWEKYKNLSGMLKKDPSKILPPFLSIFTTEGSKNTDHCQLSILSPSESNDTFPTISPGSAPKYDKEKDSDACDSNIFLPSICDSQSNKNTLTEMDILEIEAESPLPEISLQDIEDVLNGTSSEIPPDFPNLTFDVLLEEVPTIMDELYHTCIRNIENCESQFSERSTLDLQEETPQPELVASSSSCVINEMIRKQNEMASVVEETTEFQSDQSMETTYQDLMDIISNDVEFVNPGATNTTIPQEPCNCATLDQETKEEFDKEWEKIMAIVRMKKEADPVFSVTKLQK